MKWIRHVANIRHKLGRIEVVEEIYQGSKPKFKRNKIQRRVIKSIPLITVIPNKEYERTIQHFDSTAFQSSDRDYSTVEKYVAYDKEICASLCAEALIGFNTEPKKIFENSNLLTPTVSSIDTERK